MQDDTEERIREEEKSADDKALSLAEMEMERQANQFAAELLMPETVCRGAYEHYSTRLRMTARCLERHLASDLLVSPTAMGWRLQSLNLTT